MGYYSLSSYKNNIFIFISIIIIMSKPINIYRVKDSKEKHYTDKGLLFNLPFKLLMVGKSQFSGKSSCIVNLLLQDDKRLYKDEFDGDNIYIFSGSLKTDNKIKTIIRQFDIPESNLFSNYDENSLDAIYELTEEEYNDAVDNNEKPKNTLIILDDIAFGGDLKKKIVVLLIVYFVMVAI
jgi:hypothetical protein